MPPSNQRGNEMPFDQVADLMPQAVAACRDREDGRILGPWADPRKNGCGARLSGTRNSAPGDAIGPPYRGRNHVTDRGVT